MTPGSASFGFAVDAAGFDGLKLGVMFDALAGAQRELRVHAPALANAPMAKYVFATVSMGGAASG